jgi:hypothetical protein
MVLGFKPQFVDKILNKTKLHTIREDKNRRWKVGNDIHFATGVRTKNYNQFHKSRCKKVDDIEIIWNHPFKGDFSSSSCVMIDGKGYFSVLINSRRLGYSEICQLAKNDGFANVTEFAEWFSSDFKGRLIHWF